MEESNVSDVRSRLAAGEHIRFSKDDSLNYRTVPAAWIIETLVAGGTVSLTGAVISGTVEIAYRALGGYLYLTRCLIGGLRIVGCTSTTRIWLTDCWIREEVNFDRTQFDDKVTIQNCTLRRGLRAERAKFNEGMLFDHVITKYLKFTGLTSRSTLLLGGVRVAGAINLDQSQLASLQIFVSRIGPKSKPHQPAEQDGLHQMIALRRGATFEGARIQGILHVTDSHFNGYVSFSNAEVSGNAFFVRSTFGQLILARAHFFQSLTMIGSAVLQASLLNGLTVENLVRMIGCSFKTDVHLSGLNSTELTIETCSFEQRTLMERMTIKGRVDIALSLFQQDAKFVGTAISGDLAILGTVFMKAAIFGNLHIAGETLVRSMLPNDRLIASKWDGPTVLSAFGDISIFTNSTFGGTVRIVGVHFRNWVSFANSTFDSDVTFSSRIEETLSFASCTMRRSTNLSDAVVTRSLKLQDAKINRLILSHSLGTDREGTTSDILSTVKDIDISGCQYERLEATWTLLILKQLPVIPEPFVYLERFLRRSGQDEWADQAYYRGRRLVAKVDKRIIKRIGNVISDAVFGYGVKPWKAALVAALIPFFAALIYVIRPNLARLTSTSRFDCAHPAHITLGQALWLSAREYLPLDFEPHGDFIASACTGSPTLSLTLRIVGLILIPLAVAAISGLMKYIGSR